MMPLHQIIFLKSELLDMKKAKHRFVFWSVLLLSLSLFTSVSFAKKTSDQPWAVLHTNQGPIVFELYESRTPRTVSNFIGLATGQSSWIDPKTGKEQEQKPFYDGLLFFRVIPTYLLQTGCPNNRGDSGSGKMIADEYHPKLTYNSQGMVGMASAAPNANGSQFFVTLRSTPWLNHKVIKQQFCSNFRLKFRCRNDKDCQTYAKQYSSESHGTPTCKKQTLHKGATLFAKVVYGMQVFVKASESPRNNQGKPLAPLQIERIMIHRGRTWKRKWLQQPKKAKPIKTP